jgi:RsiW-degrading membrane proteinase PrsW (M82 family)
MLMYSLIGVARGSLASLSSEPLRVIVIAGAAGLMGGLALLSTYYAFEYLRARTVPASAPSSLRVWQVVALVIFWACSAWLAGLLVVSGSWKLLSTVFYVFAVCAPVYLLVRLTAGGMYNGSRRRFWGLVSTGMFLSTAVAGAAEFAVAIVAAACGALYFVVHPDQLTVLRQLTSQLAVASGLEQALTILEPWLANPFAFVLALGFFSGVTPIIEEVAKSAAVWIIFDHLELPPQGFLAGAAAGAGFGLVESLLASATPDSSWAFTLLARGGSTMMHIGTAALAGWGVGAFRAHRRAGPLIGGYASAILIHGAWNASLIALGFGGMGVAFNIGAPGPLGPALIFAGASLLSALCVSMPVGLAVINWRFRSRAMTPGPINSDPPQASQLAEDGMLNAAEGNNHHAV